MIHGEYEKLRQALGTGLRAVGLERTIEIDGPNRLGGFRLGDGDHCVALSMVPPRKKEDRDAGRFWWVSAWMPMTDGYESLLSPDLITVPHRREVLLKKPLAYEDAVVAAMQLLTELRVRSALTTIGAYSARERGFPSTPSVNTAATTPNIFRTAPNRPEREIAEPERV